MSNRNSVPKTSLAFLSVTSFLIMIVIIIASLKGASALVDPLFETLNSKRFPAIFNFGDSYSDTGSSSATFDRVPYPCGVTYLGKPSGRLCDGRLIIDFLGNAMVKSQLPRLEEFSKALYVFDIGQNDIHHALSSTTEDQARESIPELINVFALAIETLYRGGARIFWIHNTGPIGCLPYLLVKNPPAAGNTDEAGCIKSYNEVAQEFNRQLTTRISNLRLHLNDSLLVYVDIYSAKYSLISEANTHGFVDPLGYCCKHSENTSLHCWSRQTINGTVQHATACSNPTQYISWDNIHYTEVANKWVADHIVDGLLSDPPVSLPNLIQKTC